MKKLLQLEKDIKTEFDAKTNVLDNGGDKDASAFLEVALLDGFEILIQWREQFGFGLTTNREGVYGDGMDETIADSEEARTRILHLLRTRSHTHSHTE